MQSVYLVHRDGEAVADVSADDLVPELGILVRVVGHHLDDLAAERGALGDGHVVNPLSHDGIVVVAIQDSDL